MGEKRRKKVHEFMEIGGECVYGFWIVEYGFVVFELSSIA